MVAALKKAGFVAKRQKGSHVVLVSPDSGRRVVVPLHGRDLSVGITRDIIKQAGLSVDEFRQLV